MTKMTRYYIVYKGEESNPLTGILKSTLLDSYATASKYFRPSRHAAIAEVVITFTIPNITNKGD